MGNGMRMRCGGGIGGRISRAFGTCKAESSRRLAYTGMAAYIWVSTRIMHGCWVDVALMTCMLGFDTVT